jgi:hypothetical protein
LQKNNYLFKIIDDFCDKRELDQFYKEYCFNGKIQWRYDNGVEPSPVDSFATSLSIEELLNIPFILDTKNKVDSLVEPFNNSLARVFINGQPSGYDGVIHTDSFLGSLTALLFVNPQWETWWGGEFLLYNEEGTELLNGSTLKPNRLVIFSSHLKHRGLGPIHTINGVMRASLAFQYKKND